MPLHYVRVVVGLRLRNVDQSRRNALLEQTQVQHLRESKASSYTLRDTPMYTCRQRPLAECLDALG